MNEVKIRLTRTQYMITIQSRSAVLRDEDGAMLTFPEIR
jgi:hypothetical protein